MMTTRRNFLKCLAALPFVARGLMAKPAPGKIAVGDPTEDFSAFMERARRNLSAFYRLPPEKVWQSAQDQAIAAAVREQDRIFRLLDDCKIDLYKLPR